MDGDAPEPIEVELVAHDPRSDHGRRWRREPDPVGVAESAPEDDERVRRARAERTRLVLVAAVAAVLALVLGWMIGRVTTGESDVVADDGTDTARATTTVAAPFETLPIVGEEIGGADFEEPAEEQPAVTRPGAGPTTTEAAGPTVEPIAVDARLAGVPVRLVAVAFGGVLVEADLAAGTLTEFGASRITTDGSPLLVGPDWVVASSNGQSRVIRADGSVALTDLGEPWQPLHVPGSDLFWRMPRTEPTGAGQLLTLVDLTGEPVGPEIEIPLNAWPSIVDPRSGGVVITAMPRNYAVTPDGVEYLGIGTIMGLSDEVVVTFDCDETLACSLLRTDRSSGEVTPIPPATDLEEPFRWDSAAGWGASGSTPFSPDGRWLTVIGSTWRSTAAGIVELDTGRFVEMTRDSYPPIVSWSPDSRFAFTIDVQTPMAYDTTTGERFPVFAEAVNWSQLGARPFDIESPEAAGSDGGTLLRVVPGTTRDGSVAAEEAVEG